MSCNDIFEDVNTFNFGIVLFFLLLVFTKDSKAEIGDQEVLQNLSTDWNNTHVNGKTQEASLKE